MKVAAYQAPLFQGDSSAALRRIRKKVAWCETHSVTILCCPEAILGGLADYATDPHGFAINTPGDDLSRALAPLASDIVTTIVGFTELAADGALYNAAAVFHKGAVLGVYRKLHPAINQSVYKAGAETRVFDVDGLTFGVLICNDSNYPGIARSMVAQGATALFIPSNNGLPQNRHEPNLVAHARDVDRAIAIENRVWVIRADVVGTAMGLTSQGASGIVDTNGVCRQSAERSRENVIVAECPAGKRASIPAID